MIEYTIFDITCRLECGETLFLYAFGDRFTDVRYKPRFELAECRGLPIGGLSSADFSIRGIGEDIINLLSHLDHAFGYFVVSDRVRPRGMKEGYLIIGENEYEWKMLDQSFAIVGRDEIEVADTQPFYRIYYRTVGNVERGRRAGLTSEEAEPKGGSMAVLTNAGLIEP